MILWNHKMHHFCSYTYIKQHFSAIHMRLDILILFCLQNFMKESIFKLINKVVPIPHTMVEVLSRAISQWQNIRFLNMFC